MENIWKTRNGKEIKVKDMATSHILNCIRCIEEGRIQFIVNVGWAQDNDYIEYIDDDFARERWIKIFNKELERRNQDAKTRISI